MSDDKSLEALGASAREAAIRALQMAEDGRWNGLSWEKAEQMVAEVAGRLRQAATNRMIHGTDDACNAITTVRVRDLEVALAALVGRSDHVPTEIPPSAQAADKSDDFEG